MRRHLLALSTLALAGATFAAPDPSLLQTILTGSPSGAIYTGLLALPAAYLTYRLGARKNGNDAANAREQAELAALVARDKAVSDLHTQLSGLTGKVVDMASANGALQQRCETLEKQAVSRDERERDYIKEIETLKAQLKNLDSCLGGSPCPLLHRRLP